MRVWWQHPALWRPRSACLSIPIVFSVGALRNFRIEVFFLAKPLSAPLFSEAVEQSCSLTRPIKYSAAAMPPCRPAQRSQSPTTALVVPASEPILDMLGASHGRVPQRLSATAGPSRKLWRMPLKPLMPHPAPG